MDLISNLLQFKPLISLRTDMVSRIPAAGNCALMQQVLDVLQREREADIQHHGQADDLGTGPEIPERGGLGHRGWVPVVPVGSSRGSSCTAPVWFIPQPNVPMNLEKSSPCELMPSLA